MNESKHTPGPWFVDGHNLRAVIVKDETHYYNSESGMDNSERFDPICKCEGNYFTTAEFNIKADMENARLIAAAPDMYEALKIVLKDIQGDNLYILSDEADASIAAALAKANPQPKNA